MSSDELIFFGCVATVLIGYLWALFLCCKGRAIGFYFFWINALALAFVAFELPTGSGEVPPKVIAFGILLFYYAIYVILVQELFVKSDASRDDIRRLNVESNKRIDETLKIISRSLHDEINPIILTTRNAIKLILQREALTDGGTASLETLTARLQEAYERSRSLSQETCMELIDSIGFVAALESLANHYKTLFTTPRIKLTHNLTAEAFVDQNQGQVAYKIIREAVYNCIKHSKAENLQIAVVHNKILNECAVTISDDGIGIRDSLQSSSLGIGILDMREKALSIGSELQIDALNSKNTGRPGTVVTFTFPATTTAN